MSEQFEQLIDPVLKDALHRALGGDRAPEALRLRITHLLEQESVASGDAALAPAQPMRLAAEGEPAVARWRPWLFARSISAVAALVALALTLGLFYQTLTNNSAQAAGLNPGVVSQLIAAHDRCYRFFEPPTGCPCAMGHEFCEKLGLPVMAADLGADGWVFTGGDICRIDGQPIAHLFFSRGEQRLSVFTVAAGSCGDIKDGERFAVTHEHRHLASVVKGDAVYVMVANCPDGSLCRQQLDQLLQRYEAQVITPAMAVVHHDEH